MLCTVEYAENWRSVTFRVTVHSVTSNHTDTKGIRNTCPSGGWTAGNSQEIAEKDLHFPNIYDRLS